MSTCLHPTCVHGRLFPCGKCPACQQNKRQSLSNRFLLESAFCGGPTYFATITYSDENLPIYNGQPCFNKKEIQKFIKRFRKLVPQFKYFLTCEYGEQTARPHYHMLLFFSQPIEQIVVSKAFEKEWKNGFTKLSLSSDSRLAYAAKYCLKQDAYLFQNLPNDDPRKPFRLFSSRPGIGSSAIDFINQYIYNDGNIRTEFSVSGKKITFDQYFKRHIDPSLQAEIKLLTYETNFDEIQNRLLTNYTNNGTWVTDEFGKSYFKKNYEKDNEIRIHRQRLTKLKNHGL